MATKDLFEEKAQDWDARPMATILSEGIAAALMKQIELFADMSVIDFGAGTGLLCSQVAPHVKRIYAVDISESMLERLADKPDLKDTVETICQDITQIPLPEPVDLIMSAMAMHHVEDTAQLIKTFADHLNAGGKVALADLDNEDGSFHPSEAEGVFHNGIDRAELQAHLEANGFSDIHFVTAVVIEREDGNYPVFLVTATKG